MDKLSKDIYQDLIGTPFKFFGRSKEEGFDCLGLMFEMSKRLDIIMPKHTTVIDKKLRSAALENGKDLFEEIDKPKPGCWVLIRVGGLVAHVGMMIDDIRFIHCQRKCKVCIEKINTLKWAKRIEGWYVLKKIGDLSE